MANNKEHDEASFDVLNGKIPEEWPKLFKMGWIIKTIDRDEQEKLEKEFCVGCCSRSIGWYRPTEDGKDYEFYGCIMMHGLPENSPSDEIR